MWEREVWGGNVRRGRLAGGVVDTTILGWVVIAGAVLFGATVQGGIGFGMNVVVVPVLALVAPEVLPVAAIVLGIPISIAMVRHDLAGVDRPGTARIIAGRIPGTALGAWVVTVVSITGLQVLVGTMVLGFVAASALAPPIPVTAPSQVVAGVVSGVTGTAAGIGGPPIALLYQRRSGPEVRGTLASTFLVGTLLSLLALLLTGSVDGEALLVGAACAPVVLAGVRLGRRLHDLLDRGWLRPAVLAFSTVSALLVLAEAVR
jgi:uncharacterized membrane protein YfcA